MVLRSNRKNERRLWCLLKIKLPGRALKIDIQGGERLKLHNPTKKLTSFEIWRIYSDATNIPFVNLRSQHFEWINKIRLKAESHRCDDTARP